MSFHKSQLGRALGAALLVGSLGACEFIESTTSNPNRVPEARLDQLFTTAQVSSFFVAQGEGTRAVSLWIQQMAGLGQQFASLDIYGLEESDAENDWTFIYTGGGLIDINRAIGFAEQAGREQYAGILKVHKAYLLGTAASMFGAIPLTEAVDPKITEPKLDPQEQVYAALQKLLDEAIAQLQGKGPGPAALDLNFQGNPAAWQAVAHTLKARYYMHWVEAQEANRPSAQVACGGNCLQKAVAEAQMGIRSSNQNWVTIHSSTPSETSLWAQFLNDRVGYIGAGAFAVDLLRERRDPRLPVYFGPAQGRFAGTFVGSPPGAPPGDPGSQGSSLSPTGYGAANAKIPIVSCAENSLILAEAQYRLNNTAAAQQALRQAVACEESRTGVRNIPVNASLTGPALLQEIIQQKYIALFLNLEAWNDFKRTCLPRLYENQFVDLANMPQRFFYPTDERQTNKNIPEPSKQPEANENDPNACS